MGRGYTDIDGEIRRKRGVCRQRRIETQRGRECADTDGQTDRGKDGYADIDEWTD